MRAKITAAFAALALLVGAGAASVGAQTATPTPVKPLGSGYTKTVNLVVGKTYDVGDIQLWQDGAGRPCHSSYSVRVFALRIAAPGGYHRQRTAAPVASPAATATATTAPSDGGE